MFGYCSSQMGLGGWLLMIGLWGGFLALVVWAVGRFFPAERRRPAEEELDQRFAAGEIDVESYRRARAELAGTRASAAR